LLATLTPLRPGEGEAVHAKGGFAIVRARRDAHDMCVTALEVEYATRAAGDHWLEVTSASGEHAPGPPFALTIVPAQADAPSCELLAGAPTCVAAGQGWELLLRARDRFGNAWEVGGERGFCARLLAQPWSGEGAPAAVLSTVDLHDGRYALRLPSALLVPAGSYCVEVSLRGELVGCAELCVQPSASPRAPSAQRSAVRRAKARSVLDQPASSIHPQIPRVRARDDGQGGGGAVRTRTAAAAAPARAAQLGSRLRHATSEHSTSTISDSVHLPRAPLGVLVVHRTHMRAPALHVVLF
jgi:hypothetical protein